jgi:hypothetical protein
MKRDILRRVTEMEEAEAELFEEEEGVIKGKDKVTVQSDDEDEIGVGPSRIRLLGDGESDTDASESTDSEPTDPETIIEQAYLRDPGIFDRDANTRRGKGRIELRKLTGWADEQIEGWRVMLERTVSFISLPPLFHLPDPFLAREESEVGGETRFQRERQGGGGIRTQTWPRSIQGVRWEGKETPTRWG